MAYIYKGVNGKKLTEFIALLDGVQAEVDARAFEIAVRAEEALKQHRAEGIAQIDIAKGDIDAYVVLEDANGSNSNSNANSAMSIEYGRNGYKVEVVDDTGKVVNTYEVGPMEGLHILEDASHLPRKHGTPVKVPKTVKVRKRGGGRG
ncbi:DUF5403 family protein [Streptomyces sp. NPDC090075]|uniref:DUF5403 family protein n=1 Tax=Streptomyces sp. NPDC090075 TaxID=3365937 RepID=UPI00381EFE4F